MKSASPLVSLACLCLAVCSCGDSAPSNLPLQILGRTGVGPGELNYPRAIAPVDERRFVVVDKAGRLQRLSMDGQCERHWRMQEISAGKPTGIGVAPDGRVFAADTHYARVVVFGPDGELLQMVGAFGDGPGQFRLPTDVEIGPDGKIFVAEYGGNDRISVFNPDFSFVTSFRGESGGLLFNRPQCIRLARDGTLWVADACNHQVRRFTQDGQQLGAFGKLGEGIGELRYPYCVDLLSDGTLIVVEFGNNRVQRFAPDGRSLGVWGRPGREPGGLAYPWAAVVLPGDQILVVDSGNNRLQQIEPSSFAQPAHTGALAAPMKLRGDIQPQPPGV